MSQLYYERLNSAIITLVGQEPITRSVQLPYSVCETAFSQVGLFLDQPFPLQIRPFHFFWILLKVSLTILKKRGFNQKNSHTEIRYAAASLAHVESANKTHGIVGGPV